MKCNQSHRAQHNHGKPVDVWVKKIGRGQDGNGRPRLYFDKQQAVRAGFKPGQRFDITTEDAMLVITIRSNGSRIVSKKTVRDTEYPVVDVHSADMLSIFDGMAAIRVVVKPGAIYVLALASEIVKKERFDRIRDGVEAGRPLKIGSLSHGGGILSSAIHAGLRKIGFGATLAFANDIREELIEHASQHNDAWDTTTMALAMPLQELAQDEWLLSRLPKLDVLEMGLPCSGASKAGKAKRRISMMEDHPEVGHLVYAALVVLSKTQPASIGPCHA